MESTPVSRASFGTRCGGMRLQSCPRTLSLDAVGLVFLFFSPLSSDRVKEPFQPLFLCFNQDSYGMVVKIKTGLEMFCFVEKIYRITIKYIDACRPICYHIPHKSMRGFFSAVADSTLRA